MGKKLTRGQQGAVAVGFAALALVLIGYLAWRGSFPHGATHACSKQLGLALRVYAADHGGWFPYGEASPEGSLGLLARWDPTAVWFLGGKHLSRELVRQALAAGGLGPDSCGWHYVEGLREDDDPQLAVAWDKVEGLDHNGRRRPGLSHEVVFVDGSVRLVTVQDWPRFVVDQRDRLARTRAARPAGAPQIRWSDEATLGPNPEKGRGHLQEHSGAQNQADPGKGVPRLHGLWCFILSSLVERQPRKVGTAGQQVSIPLTDPWCWDPWRIAEVVCAFIGRLERECHRLMHPVGRAGRLET